MPEAYVIASGKGGTGKTSLCAGLGHALSSMGRRCLLLDADVGVRSLDLVLGAHDRAAFDFYDVVTGRASLGDAAFVPPGASDTLRVLSAPLTVSPAEIPPGALNEVVRQAAQEGWAEFVFIDCPAGLGPAFERAAEAATGGIVVATPDPVSLRSADLTADRLYMLGVYDPRLVVSRVRPRMVRHRRMPGVDDAMDMARLPLLGYVPEDESVIACQIAGLPVQPRRGGAQPAYQRIARRLLGESVPVPH